MQTRLPSELYEEILCHITSTSDLYNLRFVSRFVGHEAERSLYRNISIEESKVNQTFAEQFKDTRRASLVRHLDITSESQHCSTECLQSLRTILPYLIFLKHFTIEGSLSASAPGETFCLLEVIKKPLHTLAFEYVLTDHLPLVERQTHLRELIMHAGKVAWHPTKFPNLLVAGCPGESAFNCLAGADPRVSRLRWTQGVPNDQWPPFLNIRSMDLFLFTIDTQVFERIVRKFPCLEYLKCTIKPTGFLVSSTWVA